MKNIKKITLILLSFVMIIAVSYRFSGAVNAENNNDSQGAPSEEYFTVMDREGNVEYIEYNKEEDVAPVNAEPETYKVVSKIGEYENVIGEYDTYEEAAEVMDSSKRSRSVGDVMVMANDSVRATDYAVVRLRNKVIDYTEVDTGRTGYFHGGTAADAAYLSTSSNGQTIRIKVSGVVMDIPASDVYDLEPYATNSKVSYYDTLNGNLYHNPLYWNGVNNTTETFARVGYKLSYINENTKYFSYDGHYFYSSYKTMIDDYRNGNYNNALNAGSPYYNYYQYLSHRTATNFLSNNFDQFVVNTIGQQKSGLRSQGAAFITSQNTYGANASLMFGVAINESDWGRSNYAANRNNLFGHNAVDSDPDRATYYDSVLDSINGHADQYISKSYLNAINYTYRGPHLGDKHSGMNVKYASDAYWGEKAASHLYKLSTDSGNNSDYNKYTIGILNVGEQWFYKEANPNTGIYSSASTDGAGKDQVYDFPVTILGKVTGTDGKTWYKIQSDTPLTDNRSQISPSSTYNAGRDYVYIPASSVGYLSKSVPDDTGMVLGDVNGDRKISPVDYVLIRNHINGKSILTGVAADAADINRDGKISPTDYVRVRNHINGKEYIY